MICSLNEIEALCKKAARGAGLSWGLAEEAGKAARWLAARDLPGPRLLAGLLARNDGTAYADLAPREQDGVWQAKGDALCPLILGAALCDRAAPEAHIGRVAFPLLLAPYADMLAGPLGGVSLVWDALRLDFGPQGMRLDGPPGALMLEMAETARLAPCVASAGIAPPRLDGRWLEPPLLAVLEALARRTYAPASEESRRRGAGEG